MDCTKVDVRFGYSKRRSREHPIFGVKPGNDGESASTSSDHTLVTTTESRDDRTNSLGLDRVICSAVIAACAFVTFWLRFGDRITAIAG